jgi:hypothetical protein
LRELAADPVRRERLAAAAMGAFAERFSQDAIGARLRAALEAIA